MTMKINLGCGRDVRPGWINVDRASLDGVDIVHDLSELPLPFDDCCATTVDCKDILEHLDYVPLLGELHRILVSGGQLCIRVPHFTSKEAAADPTHVRVFSTQTLRYFVAGHDRSYYFPFSFRRIAVHLDFDRRPTYPWNYVLEPLLNLSPRCLNYFEGSPLRVFPARTISVTMWK